MGKHKASIRFKLLRGFMLISFLLFILYLIYSLILYRTITLHEQEKINLYTKSVSKNINTELESLINELAMLAASPIFPDYQRKNIAEETERFLKYHPVISSLIVCNNEGDVIHNTNPSLFSFGNSLHEYDFFSMTKNDEEIIVSDNYTENSLFITISVPFLSNSTFRGALIACVKLENNKLTFLQSIIDPGSFEWQVMLTNKKGILLYHSHLSLADLPLSRLNYSSYPSVRKALLGDWQLDLLKIENKNWYTASEFIHTANWLLIVQVPSGILFKKVLSLILPNFLILIGVTLIILILIWFWARIFINPLIKLTQALRDYGDRGTANLLPDTGEDEIGLATQSFNTMIKERQQLEKEIMEVIENERKRLGNNLHDELENILSSLYQQNLILKEELQPLLPKESKYIETYLAKNLNLIQNALQKTQYIATGLSPVSLKGKQGLTSFYELVNSIENAYHVHISLLADNLPISDEMILLNLYYIIHEAILHAIKQRSADTVTIKFSLDKTTLKINIKDNGISFTEDQYSLSMSMRMIYYSARIIGADFSVIKNTAHDIETLCSVPNISQL